MLVWSGQLHAVPTDWTAALDDWFLAANWTNGVPTAADEASVNNGGTAQAAGGATPTASMLRVGAGTGAAQAGTVSVADADLVLGAAGQLLVGQSITAGARSTGTLAVDGNVRGTLAGDSINSFVVGSAATDTEATGSVSVSGNLSARFGSAVGSAFSTGAASLAEGTLEVGGNLRGLSVVGRAFSGFLPNVGTATAIGRVQVGGNLELADFGAQLEIGVALGQGSATSATGEVAVGGSLITVASAFPEPFLSVGRANVGTASGGLRAATVDTSAQAFSSITVGVAAAGTPNAVTSTGVLRLDSGDLRVAGNTLIGGALGADGTSATGTVELGGVLRGDGANRQLNIGQISSNVFGLEGATATGSLSADGVTGMRFVNVGVAATLSSQVPIATGTLLLGSQGLAFDATNGGGDGSLVVGGAVASALNGVVTGPGPRAEGSVGVSSGDVIGYTSIVVGRVNGSGEARGALAMDGGLLETRNLSVGVTLAAAGVADPAHPISRDARGLVTVRNGAIVLLEQPLFPGGTLPGLATLGRNFDPFDSVPNVARGEMQLENSSFSGGFLNLGTGGGQGLVDAKAGSQITMNSVIVGGDGSRVLLTDSSLKVVTHPDVAFTGSLFVGSPGQGEVHALRSNIDVAGNLLIVGSASPDALGKVHIEDGSLQVDGFTRVGNFDPSSRGELSLSNSTGEIGSSLFLGQSANAGQLFGEALLSLDSSLLTVSGSLFTDLGATMRFGVAGLDRGLGGYGALDALNAELTGNLFVDFALAALPPLPFYQFDLIVTKEVGAIIGDFLNVSLLSLPVGYAATYGIVNDDFGGDIWRLSLRAVEVTEPGVLGLMLGGLLGLGLVRRRLATGK